MYQYLDSIQDPKDLRALPLEVLPKVSAELRDFLISSVSKTGGHLGASLGVVELTIALHYCYNTPIDKIVWDVGHQAYGHKIITGRKQAFHSLRQFQGLCGFPKRSESIYDTFAVGHAGTALSAAFGMAVARNRKNETFQVVAIVGDAAISNGLSMEAMNNIGNHSDVNLTVILNDNEMSISPSVGAMTTYLNKILMGHSFNVAKNRLESLIEGIPNVGPRMLKIAQHAQEAIKGFVTPGALFEELGFRYYGPFDGHNIFSIIETFQRIQQLSGPIFLHMITQKGKGYAPAEENPEKFHGVSTFDKTTGTPVKTSPTTTTYTQVFGETLLELIQADNRIIGITAAMPEGTGLKKLSEQFPKNYIDVGIAEGHAVCMAAGLACEGMKPVVAIYSTFLQRAYDQIIHDVCLQKLPVVFALDRSGIVGEDGETHQGAFDLTYLRCIPHMTIMAPADENELRNMLYTALTMSSPVSIRYPRGSGEGVLLDNPMQKIEIGKGVILEKGNQYVILAIGKMVGVAKQVHQLLKQQTMDGYIVNMRFVKPLDEDLIFELAQLNLPIITIEESSILGGFGSAVLESLQKLAVFNAAVKLIGIPDVYVPHGNPQTLRDNYGLDATSIAGEVKKFVNQVRDLRKGNDR
jgi:1-deoxy-D-xylulose-5-phosphate synthase